MDNATPRHELGGHSTAHRLFYERSGTRDSSDGLKVCAAYGGMKRLVSLWAAGCVKRSRCPEAAPATRSVSRDEHRRVKKSDGRRTGSDYCVPFEAQTAV